MSYRLEKQEPIDVAVRRIADEQSAKALAELSETAKPAGWRIHQLRKRCKKLRALVRLVRPGFDDYKAANVCFRDIARQVSDERDERVIADCVSKLVGDDESPIVRWHFLRCELAEELADPVLDDLSREMANARVMIERWDLADLTPEDMVGGVQKTLARAHDELKNVRENGSVRDYHELRKRAKYHWYHLRLLKDLIGESGDERRKKFDALAECLGDSHDRSVLLERLQELPHFLKRDIGVQRLEAAALRERRKLRREALAISRPLFNIAPDAFEKSLLPG